MVGSSASASQTKTEASRNHLVENARRGQHAGQAGAGMGAGADEEEIAHVLAALCGRNQALCVRSGSNDEAGAGEELSRS